MSDGRFLLFLVGATVVACVLLILGVERSERGMKERGESRMHRLAESCRLRLSVAATAADSAVALDAIPATDYIGKPRCSYWVVSYPEVHRAR